MKNNQRLNRNNAVKYFYINYRKVQGLSKIYYNEYLEGFLIMKFNKIE